MMSLPVWLPGPMFLWGSVSGAMFLPGGLCQEVGLCLEGTLCQEGSLSQEEVSVWTGSL